MPGSAAGWATGAGAGALGVGAGYNREDISNLDQRVEDFHARADATLPVTSDLSLVGGVGFCQLAQ